MKQLSSRRLFTIDSICALGAGIIVLLLNSPLSELLRLPSPLLRTLSVISLLYGVFSGTLALQDNVHKFWTKVLVILNSAYVLLDLTLLIRYADEYSVWGALFFIIEATVIIFLIRMEMRLLFTEKAKRDKQVISVYFF